MGFLREVDLGEYYKNKVSLILGARTTNNLDLFGQDLEGKLTFEKGVWRISNNEKRVIIPLPGYLMMVGENSADSSRNILARFTGEDVGGVSWYGAFGALDPSKFYPYLIHVKRTIRADNFYISNTIDIPLKVLKDLLKEPQPVS